MDFAKHLSGGDLRSLGRSEEVVKRLLADPGQFQDLIACLWHEDPVVRMRAADSIEKISVEHPDWLHPFRTELLGLAEETNQKEVQWHMALMIPRMKLTDKPRAIKILRRYMQSKSSIVKTFAMDALSKLLSDPRPLLEEATRTGTPAMNARARNLLKEL